MINGNDVVGDRFAGDSAASLNCPCRPCEAVRRPWVNFKTLQSVLKGNRMKIQNPFMKALPALLLIAPLAAPSWGQVPRPATDEEVQALIAEAGDSEEYPGADLFYVLDEADVLVRDSGLATTETRQVIKVLTDAGVRSQSVLREDYDPANNRFEFKAVRVHRKGGTIDEVDVDSTVTQPAKQWAIYWGNQQQLLEVPRLAIGDCLEVRYSKTGFNLAYLGDSDDVQLAANGEVLKPPMPGHWHDTVLFQGRHPIGRKRYSVHMPDDKPLQYEVYNDRLRSSLWFDGDRHVYTFTVEDIPAVDREPHMVAFDDVVAKVVLSTVPDWETKARWFHDANIDQFNAGAAVREKVHELTDHLESDEEKIAMLLHWVADNIRYYGTTRGAHEGYTLHAGPEIFKDRGGVCKDKAGMLITMLRVLGYEVYAALTMAGSRVEAIPADQFNHSITVMRNEDGTFQILDPTWSPLSKELWSSREALQHLVYGTPEGQPLTQSPYFPPEHNLLSCTSESRIADDGTLRTDVSMDLKGYPCTYLRRNADRYQDAERRAGFERVLSIAPNARLEHLEHIDPYDYSRDGFVNMTVTADGYVANGGAVALFRLPLMSHPLGDFFIPDLFYSVDAKEREYAMRMRATRLVRYEETIRLPSGWKVDHVPEAKKIESPSADLSFEVTPGDESLTYRFELAIKNHIIPPEDYPEFRKAIHAMKEISDEWVVCTIGDRIVRGDEASDDQADREG